MGMGGPDCTSLSYMTIPSPGIESTLPELHVTVTTLVLFSAHTGCTPFGGRDRQPSSCSVTGEWTDRSVRKIPSGSGGPKWELGQSMHPTKAHRKNSSLEEESPGKKMGLWKKMQPRGKEDERAGAVSYNHCSSSTSQDTRTCSINMSNEYVPQSITFLSNRFYQQS